jgi:hypothetical protein
MDEQEARLILQSYAPGAERHNPEVAAALEAAARNPELAGWFAEEQAFDRAVAAHLEAVPAPFGLKTRILAQLAPPPAASRPWSLAVKLAGVAALLFLLVQVVSFFRPPASEARVSNYAQEMVSFIRLGGALDMESHDLGKIEAWLSQKNAAPQFVPPNLASLRPLGCRLLSFRGQTVTLICFQQGPDRLAHLFVVDRAALPRLKPGDAVILQREGDWTTATWAEKDRVYMIAAQGDETAVQPYLPHA